MEPSDRENAIAVIKELQEWDVASLAREEELGRQFAFNAAVSPAKRLRTLFQQIPIAHLTELPGPQLQPLAQQANAILNRFRDLIEFDPTKIENPAAQRTFLVTQLEEIYDGVFASVWHQIAYLSSRERDFGAMEVEARSVVETVRREAATLKQSLEAQNADAAQILQEIRQVAAEQGVSQHAIHFKNEADHHKAQSDIWFARTLAAGGVLLAYAVASLFIHNIPGAYPDGPNGAIQLAISKVLIFGIIAYVLFLVARNYMSHRHNEVVNRHRQNALATFTALAEATSDAASADIVLGHAAACIFSPQETGLTKQDMSGSDGVPALQIMPRIGQMTAG